MTILGKIKKDLTREKDYENFLCRYGLYFLLFLLIMVLLSNLAIFFWLKGKANLTLNETTPIRIKTELYAKIKKNLEKNKLILETSLQKNYRNLFQ